MRAIYRYYACGLRCHSEVELRGVALAPDDAAPEVVVRYGSVPESLPQAHARGAAFEAAPGELLLRVPRVGRFLVQAGERITIEPEAGACETDVALFVMNAAYGALLQQRGIVVLPASAVQIADGCVAFAGTSAAGKSALAAFLQQRGYLLHGDVLCPVEPLPSGGAVAAPGWPQLQLWADTLRELRIDRSRLTPVREGLEKYEYLPSEPPCDKPLPLRCLYLLCESLPGDPCGIEPIASAQERLKAVLSNLYRFRFVRKDKPRAELFRKGLLLASSVSVRRLWMPPGLARLPEVIEQLEVDWHMLQCSLGRSHAKAA